VIAVGLLEEIIRIDLKVHIAILEKQVKGMSPAMLDAFQE
jgi:hypothetical protein